MPLIWASMISRHKRILLFIVFFKGCFYPVLVNCVFLRLLNLSIWYQVQSLWTRAVLILFGWKSRSCVDIFSTLYDNWAWPYFDPVTHVFSLLLCGLSETHLFPFSTSALWGPAGPLDLPADVFLQHLHAESAAQHVESRWLIQEKKKLCMKNDNMTLCTWFH